MIMSNLMQEKLAIVEPIGYVTAANVSQFQEELTTLVTNKNYYSFLVDMDRVEFMDSAGLMALVAAFRLAQTLGKRFSLCSLAPSVRIIFELTQLDRAFDIFVDRQQFEGSLRQKVAA
nr:STAS domain-containing protein [Aphanothece sacrum]